MNKEQIYDEQIFPLMSKIIDICKEHNIDMLADFAIPNDSDPFLCCTTALLGTTNPPEHMVRALNIIAPGQPSPLMVTTTHKDGSKTLTAILP